MPRKSSMRDNVIAVRSRLPHLSDLSREKIELALLYYELNIDETVEAFKRNGAIEALGGWTEMGNGRGNTSSKRTNDNTRNRNNKPSTLSTNSLLQNPPSNGILRPSQRVSNLFQTFAIGGIPTITTNGSTTMSNTTACSPSSISSSSFIEQSDNNHDLTITHDETIEQQKSQLLSHIENHDDSISSTIQNHEPSTITNSQPTTVAKLANNKKLLTKSVKDLQRQTSTLTNVEILFNNEIKSSIKRIDDIFKQIHEILKQREVEIYLEMDKVKEHGLNIIHNRQKRAIELRQRIDRCDRLEPFEIDNLRHDIKQFVTDRRYDLGEELTTSHRFEYDQTIIDLLKNFGHVSPVERTRLASISSAFIETNTSTIEKQISDVTSEKIQISKKSNRIPSISHSSNEIDFINKQQEPLPQRIINNQQLNGEIINIPTNGYVTGDYHQHFNSSQQINGSLQYYNDTNVNRRRTQQYSQGNLQRSGPIFNYHNGNNRRNGPKQINDRIDLPNNSKTTNTYRRPRPPPQSSQPIVPVQT
ncbi:unnamed protein product [Rotaria sordida]|uniref:Uncharacterized protein n=1 Tax=Rotaria sordida TaxID=392033 RepID=A0A815B2V7_9BILA|nr:unnamed protein product [Rotaria sordida]